LRQTFLLNEHCIEEWFFTFGYVIPNSTNTWQQVIKSAGKGKMMSPEILSGNVIIDTKFYDEESVIFENRMRVYYI
jgi:retinal rod rhodopsin-sensitive cGMP 3',5'-cyclic phosphodiesterase subunit delta